MQEAKVRSIKFFRTENGSEPVREWLVELEKKGRRTEVSQIRTRIQRAGLGNFGSHRFLKGSFGELKVDLGPGYRVYFGIEGDVFLILLGGGTKQSQQEDIESAQSRWDDYMNEKRKDSRYGRP